MIKMGGYEPCFKLSDLNVLYCERLQKLGGDATGQIRFEH